jgi:glycosyltransferase involved in cell wall biosynthesis
MKILLISYKFFPDIGGIEVNSELLADYFNKFGAEICVVTTSTTDVLNDKDFPYKVVRNPGKLQLIKLHFWADVIFENNPSLNLSWPRAFISRPHCIALRTWISRIDDTIALQDKIKKLWLKKADAVIAVSKKVKELTYSKAIVIGNPYRNHLFRNLNIEREKDFVFLGRLVSDKGVDMAIDLLHNLHGDPIFTAKKFTLTIVGDGPEREALMQKCNEYKLNNYVTFTGILRGDDLVKCLNHHRYLLAPSRWREPFGNIALEGMACGCLPIVSNGGGLPDAVGNAGVVFERNSMESLTGEVKNVLLNPDYESLLRSNSGTHLNSHKPEFVAQQYFEIIKSIL